jgi:hypothetical protein
MSDPVNVQERRSGRYSCDEAKALPLAALPPVTSTFPFSPSSRTAVWSLRALMLPVGFHPPGAAWAEGRKAACTARITAESTIPAVLGATVIPRR